MAGKALSRAAAAEKRLSEDWQRRVQERRASAADKRLRQVYGITQATYDAMLAAQGDKCAICRSGRASGSSDVPFVVDHCHTTGKVRALLCHMCNHGLGRFRDSPQSLIAAARYIVRHQASLIGSND